MCLYELTLREVVGPSKTILTPGEGRSVKAGDIRVTAEPKRYRTPFRNLNEALKGGIAENTVTQVAGEPGSGKSTLVAQCLDEHVDDVLYIGVEETAEEIVRRGRRTRLRHLENLSIFCSDDPERIQAEIIIREPKIVVLDSLSKMRRSAEEMLTPILEAEILSDMCRFAKRLHQHADRPGSMFTMLVISHVNKTGQIAGMRKLQHEVDTVWKLRKVYSEEEDEDLSFQKKRLSKQELEERTLLKKARVLQIPKNRIGGEPLISPRFVLETDGFHEYEAA